MSDEEDLFSVFDNASELIEDIRKSKKTKIVSVGKEKEKKKDKEAGEDEGEGDIEDITSGMDEVSSSRSGGVKRGIEDGEDGTPPRKKRESLLEDINPSDYETRIQCFTLDCPPSCTHEVAVPPDHMHVPLRPLQAKPAKTYPFTLDPFQNEAVRCIENNQSVLVSAHTSAGKTVVAEYAIAQCIKEKRRIIYTTPIKALSNQKFRDFSEEFEDVGIMTGDVTINPTATVLIMTTEILRSMQYRGSEIVREVGWVVFDEIHYMRDKERGYVWEETIILLQDNVRYVFLSATVPNARQFAEWVCSLHRQPCHVVYTDFRPTPLQNYVFPAGGDGLHLVVDEGGNFKEENFNTAMAVLQKSGDEGKSKDRTRGGGIKESSPVYKIVKMIMERNFAPVIVFNFSKKDCEAYALQCARLDFNTVNEKKLVDEVFYNAIDVLNDEDKKLPQVESVLPLLRRGIGIHHGGLLPILKETIEILFSEGLIKALFATETFAMGLNMPARTVLFSTCRKYDGTGYRPITSGEYIQMSGRAGRRGLDDKGIVILIIDEKMDPTLGKNLLKGSPDALDSAYHLTYNMVLNLLRVEEINPEFMLERSFFQFQNNANIPAMYKQVKQLSKDMAAMNFENESEVATYHNIRKNLEQFSLEFQAFITLPKYIVPFLQPGRMIRVKNALDDFGWGIVVSYKEETKTQGKMTENFYIVNALLHLSKQTENVKSVGAIKPCEPGQKGVMKVVPIMLNLITKISSVRLYFPNDLKPLDNRMSVLKSLQEVEQRFPDAVPLLDPATDLKIKEKKFLEIVKKIQMFEGRLEHHPLNQEPGLEDTYTRYKQKLQVAKDLSTAKNELKKSKNLLQMEDLKCRKRVLRRLGYATAEDVIEIKGRMACELDSGDELLLTEMVFNGHFTELTVAQTMALLSCVVCDERTSDNVTIRDDLAGPLRRLQELARRVAKVCVEAKMEVIEEEYVDKFKPFLMEVTHQWCNGASFATICKMTDIFEGSIIRCMRRLEELTRQLVQAAKGIGNTELENKFNEGIKLLKRDIVFAASLYL